MLSCQPLATPRCRSRAAPRFLNLLLSLSNPRSLSPACRRFLRHILQRSFQPRRPSRSRGGRVHGLGLAPRGRSPEAGHLASTLCLDCLWSL